MLVIFVFDLNQKIYYIGYSNTCIYWFVFLKISIIKMIEFHLKK